MAELVVDTHELEARAEAIRASIAPAGRPGGPSAAAEAAILVRVIGLLDLTSLGDDDTPADILDLCRDALHPIAAEIRESLDIEAPRHGHVAAVCVFDRFVPVAHEALGGSAVRVAAVTAGFPHPQGSLDERLTAVRATVRAGADEVDLVITREHALKRRWAELYEEVSAMREACGDAVLKTILAAGDLDGLDTVARAGLVCCMAGADFIKTSTGRETVNATLPIGLAMTVAIERYTTLGGAVVGLKPAGGIRTARQAEEWVRLVSEELGPEWLRAQRFRIGASSLLENIRERLRTSVGDPHGDGRGA